MGDLTGRTLFCGSRPLPLALHLGFWSQLLQQGTCHAPLSICNLVGLTDGWSDGWGQLTPGMSASDVPIPVWAAYPSDLHISFVLL
jgi:hypothetical protein